MDKTQLFKIFSKPFSNSDWLKVLHNVFGAKQLLSQPREILLPSNDKANAAFELGNFTTSDDRIIGLYRIELNPDVWLERNKVGLRRLLRSIYKYDVDGAIIVFDQGEKWRLSFVSEIKVLNDEGEVIKQATEPKRYTYLLGKDKKVKTPSERLNKLAGKTLALNDILEAFSVESLSKEFYDKLYKWYEKAQKQVVFPNDEQAENHSQTSLIRMLTRLLFIWFIKEKQLINVDLFDKDKLQTLIDYEKPSSFYKAILQNLFFATLNRPVTERSFRTTTNGKPNQTNYLATTIYRYQSYFNGLKEADIIALFDQAPFLNGGLFECLDREASDEEKQAYDNDKTIRPIGSAIRIDGFSDRADNELVFHNHLFFKDTIFNDTIFNDNKQDDKQDLGLIDLFNQYQFTVEESTPLDVEVALDPELLGKVFENLLASYNPETGQQARKATGSFYTPREIVNYMVDESLKQHFHQHTDLTDEQINALFVDAEFTEQENALNKQQTKALIYAIDGLKILDPAVGSGAYPMGILQRLVLILEKVDAENTHFKQQQIDKAEQIPDEASCASAIAGIEQVFSQQNQHNAYGKKLMLIENCIYGVDIQPIAIQICKLRFFISLTIEQSPNKNKADNYGIKALPNLETKFIVANSLLPLGEMPKQKGIFDTGIEELQTKLAQVRHKHFSAKTLTTKRRYRDKDKDLREQMLEELTKSGITPAVEASMKRIVHWDLYNQNAIADWFDPKWMFGVDSFDIVIGNPPYIQLQKDGGRLGDLYQHCDFKTFAKTGDIYQLFYEKGMGLLKDAQGNLAFITSNSWMRAKYGGKLRQFFSEKHKPLRLIDMGKDAFGAIVDTNILLVRKGNREQEFMAVDMDSVSEKQFPPAKQYWSGIQASGEMVWSILSPAEKEIKTKIEQIGTPLKDWDIRINYGIKTGFNEAFIINTAKRDELIRQDPKSAEIIKPVLRGRDIKAYEHHWAGLWLIATFPVLKINIDHYPAIKNHLLSFSKDRLEQAGKRLPDGKKSRKKTGNKWFETQDQIGYYEEFAKEKLIWIELVDKGRFVYDDKAIYCEATTFIMTGNSTKYLCAILNSRVVYWFLSQVAPTSGMGTLRWKKVYIETIPVPLLDKTKQQPFIALVDKILTAKQHGQDTSTLETQIDQMVYRLYDLTDEEVRIVEKNV